jgi:hypothetical protein
MRRSKLFIASSSPTGKIQRLYKLLVKEKTLFEEMACHINDGALRCTVLSLAQQNNQYAAELSSYIKCTGGRDFPAFVIETSSTAVLPATPKEIYPDESGILAYCRNNERKIMLAYRRLLRESLLYEGLQKMVSYQLSGIVAAFMQLKLLSSLKKI